MKNIEIHLVRPKPTNGSSSRSRSNQGTLIGMKIVRILLPGTMLKIIKINTLRLKFRLNLLNI